MHYDIHFDFAVEVPIELLDNPTDRFFPRRICQTRNPRSVCLSASVVSEVCVYLTQCAVDSRQKCLCFLTQLRVPEILHTMRGEGSQP